MKTIIKSEAELFRVKLEVLEGEARELIKIIKALPSEDFGNKGEVIAQATLAMRHIEDARMKYGKVIQYNDNGVSCYTK